MRVLLDIAVDVCPLMEIELTYSGGKSHDSSASIDQNRWQNWVIRQEIAESYHLKQTGLKTTQVWKKF